MLIMLGMPVVQIILFGFAISTEVKNVRTAIVLPEISQEARQVVDRVNSSEYFTVQAILSSPEELDVLFRSNQIDLAIVFPSDYAASVRLPEGRPLIMADASEPNLAVTRSSYAGSVLAEAESLLTGFSPVSSTKGIVPDIRLLYNPQMRSAYNFVPGVMGLILMLICAMMTSIAIVREKETGTMEILLVSPLNPIYVVLAKAVPYLILSLLNLTSILLLAHFVLDVPVAGSLWTLGFVSFLFILAALALGLMISNLVRTQVAAMLASGMVLMMPTLLLSGMVFPIDSMPWPLRFLSALIPARWYIDIVRKVMIEGVSFPTVLPQTLILLVMALLLLAASIKKFNNKLTR